MMIALKVFISVHNVGSAFILNAYMSGQKKSGDVLCANAKKTIIDLQY